MNISQKSSNFTNGINGECRKPNNKVEAKLKSKYYGKNKNRKKVHHL